MAFEDNLKPKQQSECPFDILVTDGDFKVRSEPNSRTSSVKYKSRSRAKEIAAMEEDKRRNSLPLSTEMVISGSYNDQQDGKRQQIRRVRSFRMTSKGIKTDIEHERRQSNASLYSTLSQKECFRQRLSSETSTDSAICCGCSSTSSTGYYRVCVIGADAVGKTALTNQFMSSEFLSTYDFDNDEIDEQTMSVVIDNEESTLEFIDFSKHQDEIEKYSFDAFIIVFSVHERSSYDFATRYMRYLRNELYNDRATVLVANKVDLVRKRQITSEEAKQQAKEFNCKYIETSAALNHQVDELLVGILRQIKNKLNPEMNEKAVHDSEKCDSKRLKGPKGLISKIFKRKSKSPTDILLDCN